MIYVLVNSIHLPGLPGKAGGPASQVSDDDYILREDSGWLLVCHHSWPQHVATPIVNVRYRVADPDPFFYREYTIVKTDTPAVPNEANKPAKKAPSRK